MTEPKKITLLTTLLRYARAMIFWRRRTLSDPEKSPIIEPSLKYYVGIDELPVWNYDKVITEKDIRYLLRLKNYRKLPIISKKLIRSLNDIWDNVPLEIIDAFGFTPEQLTVLYLEKSIQIARLTFVATGDPSIENRITFMSRQLEALEESFTTGERQPLEEKVAYIEMYRKIPLDPYTTTVRQFMTYLKLYNDYTEEQKRQEQARKNRNKRA